MKIAIISDSHRARSYMDKAIEIIKKEEIDLIVHAGDNFADSKYFNQKTEIPVLAVAGNCDYENVETEIDFEFEGVKFFLTHGHHYGVKYGLEILAQQASAKNADIAIFGHSHVKKNCHIANVEIINPGSLSMPRDGSERSFVIMDLNEGKYTYEYIFI